MGSVCFRIEGEFLTDFCRGLVTEGKWRHALSTLVDGLPGISTDQALSVLQGTHKFFGTNAVDLVPEDRAEVAAAHVDLVRWQNAGLWRRPGGIFWRPYAVVTTLGRRDVPEGVSSLQRPEKWARERVMFYADDPRTDDYTDEPEVLDRLELSAVLWKRAEDPPLWLKGSDTSAEALREFLDLGHHLHERGAWDEGADGVRRPSRVEPTTTVKPLLDFDQIYKDLGVEVSLADRLTLQLGVEGKVADAVQAIFGEVDTSAPAPDPRFAAESGYILPDGRFYGCPYMHHPILASRILRHVYGTEVEDSQKEADRRNWLRIQASAVYDHWSPSPATKWQIMSPKGRPTRAQERALAEWCIAHEHPYPRDLRHE